MIEAKKLLEDKVLSIFADENSTSLENIEKESYTQERLHFGGGYLFYIDFNVQPYKNWFRLDFGLNLDNLNVKVHTQKDADWLKTYAAYCNGQDLGYDVIIGPIEQDENFEIYLDRINLE